MSNVQELLNSFMSGELSGVSALKLRDENIQKKKGNKRINTLKKEPKKKSKLLIITELAVPFNPFTGVEDEQYNRNSKFRPTLSQTSVMLMLKTACNENAELKKVYMDKARVTEWDTSDTENVTSQDRLVFNRYRVPRQFTLPVCRVNIPSFTGNVFGKEYLMNVKRDELTDEIVGEVPLILQVNKLLRDMNYEEINQLEEKIQKKEIVLNDKDKENQVKAIREKVVVSGDYPLNYVMAIEIPLDNQYHVKDLDSLSACTPENFIDKLRLIKCTAEVDLALDKYKAGEYSAVDIYDDFWEYDMNCPNEEDKKELGKKTRYERAMTPVNTLEGYENLIDAYREYMDSAKDLEKTFMNSVYVSKFNSSMEDSFLNSVKSIVDLNSEFMTNKVLNANASIITLVFGDEADAKLAEMAIGGGTEGSLDEKASEKAGKEVDFMSIMDSEDDEEDMPELEIN